MVPLLPRDAAQFAPHHIHRPVPSLHGQERAQRSRLRIVSIRMAPQLDKHILDNVLRRGAVPQNTQRGTVRGRREPVEDLSESVIVSGRQARREQRIGPHHIADANAGHGHRAMLRRGSVAAVSGEPGLRAGLR